MKNIKKRKKLKRRTKRLIFYTLLIILPLIQFCIFYIGVNFSSIMLAFKKFSAETNRYVFAGFTNFVKIYNDWNSSPMLAVALKNSLIIYGVSLLCLVLSTMFS